MRKFYDNHYQIQEKTNMEKQLMEENKKLKEELNAIVNSKSWKITKPIRDFRTKKLK